MASLTEKGDYWRLSFYDANRSPKRKELYYKRKDVDPEMGYTEHQMKIIKRDLEYEFKHNKYDPWEKKRKKKEGILLSDAIELFMKKQSKILAPSTIKKYKYMLNYLLREYGNRDLTDLSKDFWEEYVNDSESFGTRENRNAVLSGFYKRIQKEGYNIEMDVEIYATNRERKSKNIVTSKEWLTKEEMEDIIASIPSFAEFEVTENKKRYSKPLHWIEPIIRLAFYTGMRISDLFALKPSWVREDLKVIRIGGEYNPKSQLDEEIMPTLPEARPLLKELISKNKGNEVLFSGHRAGYASRKFKNLIRYYFRNDPKRAETITFHSLRHSFVMYCMDDLKLRNRVIKQLTRHKDDRSLAKYTHHNVDAALEEIKSNALDY
ncbi:MAG: hypothetical protein CL666_14495 [Balneola sp.]|nr:hypothetical protein [Balneola sp.]|tara:strand:- start:46227 stop:47360 length:1134 start_codon:yes stop_codon:yes gene_type:complete